MIRSSPSQLSLRAVHHASVSKPFSKVTTNHAGFVEAETNKTTAVSKHFIDEELASKMVQVKNLTKCVANRRRCLYPPSSSSSPKTVPTMQNTVDENSGNVHSSNRDIRRERILRSSNDIHARRKQEAKKDSRTTIVDTLSIIEQPNQDEHLIESSPQILTILQTEDQDGQLELPPVREGPYVSSSQEQCYCNTDGHEARGPDPPAIKMQTKRQQLQTSDKIIPNVMNQQPKKTPASEKAKPDLLVVESSLNKFQFSEELVVSLRLVEKALNDSSSLLGSLEFEKKIMQNDFYRERSEPIASTEDNDMLLKQKEEQLKWLSTIIKKLDGSTQVFARVYDEMRRIEVRVTCQQRESKGRKVNHDKDSRDSQGIEAHDKFTECSINVTALYPNIHTNAPVVGSKEAEMQKLLCERDSTINFRTKELLRLKKKLKESFSTIRQLRIENEGMERTNIHSDTAKVKLEKENDSLKAQVASLKAEIFTQDAYIAEISEQDWTTANERIAELSRGFNASQRALYRMQAEKKLMRETESTSLIRE